MRASRYAFYCLLQSVFSTGYQHPRIIVAPVDLLLGSIRTGSTAVQLGGVRVLSNGALRLRTTCNNLSTAQHLFRLLVLPYKCSKPKPSLDSMCRMITIKSCDVSHSYLFTFIALCYDALIVHTCAVRSRLGSHHLSSWLEP